MNAIFARIQDVFQLFFPETCEICGTSLRNGEHLICTDCLLDIPKINLYDCDQNLVVDMLVGTVPFIKAAAFFNYQKHSGYAHLIHKLKYQGRDDIGILLGEMFAVELDKIAFFCDIDAIVPIPLHRRRQRKRGYNQSQKIAEGIAHIVGVPIYDKVVERVVYTDTQTKKNKEERMHNVKDIFKVVDPIPLAGKHILVLDDVITTGATCLACAETIMKESQVRQISIAGIAIAL